MNQRLGSLNAYVHGPMVGAAGATGRTETLTLLLPEGVQLKLRDVEG